MSERGLKIALAVSLGLNLFLIGGGVSAGLFAARYLHEHPFARHDGGGASPLAMAAGKLPADTRLKLDATMHAAARAAAADFHLARDSRRSAADLAASASFDRAAVVANLDQARAAETRGRMRLEGALLDVMQALPADQRATLAPVLKGRPRGQRNGQARGPDRGPEAPAPAKSN